MGNGMNFDQISDAERIRDYGLMVVYSELELENHLKDNGVYKNVLSLGSVCFR